MKFELFAERYSVVKLRRVPNPQTMKEAANGGLVFLSVTDEEISLVVPTNFAPDGITAREDGWRAFRVAGNLDFSEVGILSNLTGILARASIPVFAVSTFDTDYLLVKETSLANAAAALSAAGHEVRARRSDDSNAETNRCEGESKREEK